MPRYLCPACAFVVRHKKTAARPTALPAPSVNNERPHARKQSLWIFRIHHQVGAAGVFIGEEYANPILATIGSAKHAAIVLRTVCMTFSTSHDVVWIFRIDHDVSNAPGLVQTHQRPGF